MAAGLARWQIPRVAAHPLASPQPVLSAAGEPAGKTVTPGGLTAQLSGTLGLPALGAHVAAVVSFFFNDTAPTEIYTLSLHDALPISTNPMRRVPAPKPPVDPDAVLGTARRSEEHTSELQSPYDLVCRLLLEKKK